MLPIDPLSFAVGVLSGVGALVICAIVLWLWEDFGLDRDAD